MPTEATTARSSSERLREALEEISEPYCDRRNEVRSSFFGPASVATPDVTLSVFVRDLSLGGIGLVHFMPLRTGLCKLHLPISSGRTIDLDVDIKWCRDYGDGWYASGGSFTDSP